MNASLNKIKKVACQAVKKAGQMAKREFDRFDRSTIKLKSHHEIITKVDLKSEEIIISEIKKHFPGHSILSEERGKADKHSNFWWIIDPIDGTTNFSMHNPLWAISVAVARAENLEECRLGQAEIIFGLVYAPVLDEIYLAQKGRGAKRGSKKIKVSRIKSGKVLNTFCHGSRQQDIKRALAYYQHQKLSGFDCRQLGSAALELAFVASGRIESIMIPGANSWDVAAGVLLVREAGGRVTDFQGREWSLSSRDMLATNGLIHSQLLKVVKKL